MQSEARGGGGKDDEERDGERETEGERFLFFDTHMNGNAGRESSRKKEKVHILKRILY